MKKLLIVSAALMAVSSQAGAYYTRVQSWPADEAWVPVVGEYDKNGLKIIDVDDKYYTTQVCTEEWRGLGENYQSLGDEERCYKITFEMKEVELLQSDWSHELTIQAWESNQERVEMSDDEAKTWRPMDDVGA
ncbi:MAG: hypothetical protein LBG89_03650 [Rickettsiales bacterium]|nr:hypothetical protein [Rickettsiales bacterium]